MPHFTYILECLDGTWYTGYTTDPLRRLRMHQSGKGAKYTKARGAVRILVAFECSDKSTAMSLEAAIKKKPRASKAKIFWPAISGAREILGISIIDSHYEFDSSM